MKCCKTKTTVILTVSQSEGKYQRELINLEEEMLENMEMMLLLLFFPFCSDKFPISKLYVTLDTCSVEDLAAYSAGVAWLKTAMTLSRQTI